jgi:hypothetical protein
VSHDARFWIETIALWQPVKSAMLFAWGAGDPFWVLLAKRMFLLLPLGAAVLGYWTSVLSIPTIVVRARRRTFVGLVIVTWWDLARAAFAFWGGTFRFALTFVIALLGAVQMIVTGAWAIVQEIILMPLRLVRSIGSNVLNPGVPWIAVTMTFFWCVFEAIIFTFVTTSLVIDTLSNLAGTQMTETGIRIPLFLFMLFIALGSYAVLSSFTEAVQSRNWLMIVKIGVVESVALFVEVVFLYREFVDALVPWFAQHTSGKFELGIAGTLAIAGLVWLGVRSVWWFLFAGAGTPTILAIISGQGVAPPDPNAQPPEFQLFSDGFSEKLRKEFEWAGEEGAKVLDAFLVPPMQVVAAALNFVVLLTSNRHLLDLPLNSVADFKDARTLTAELNEQVPGQAA